MKHEKKKKRRKKIRKVDKRKKWHETNTKILKQIILIALKYNPKVKVSVAGTFDSEKAPLDWAGVGNLEAQGNRSCPNIAQLRTSVCFVLNC